MSISEAGDLGQMTVSISAWVFISSSMCIGPFSFMIGVEMSLNNLTHFTHLRIPMPCFLTPNSHIKFTTNDTKTLGLFPSFSSLFCGLGRDKYISLRNGDAFHFDYSYLSS